MTKIDISTSTFVRLILLVLGVWFLFIIRDVLILLFLVVIIVAGLSPTIDRWSKTITRPGAVISVFLLFFVILAAILSLLVPPLINQIQDFSFNLPAYTEALSRQHSGFFTTFADLVVKNLNTLTSQLSDLGGALFTKTVGVISGVVATITVIVLTFYLLLEEEGLKKIYKGIIPEDWHEALSETTRKIAGKLGAWIRGQLLLMFAVGFFTALGLLAIGTPYALSLGIWSGITEVIPILGPWIGAAPGIIVGLASSPLHGFLALLVYTVVQQLESNLLVPRVMAKAVGLNPVIVIVAILIGGKLYGILGIMLAVPLAAVIGVIAGDWQIIRQTFTAKK